MLPIAEPYKITSPFGAKRNIPPWGEHTHDGVDLVSNFNQNVYAAAGGKVISDRDTYEHAKRWVAGSGNSVGNRVIIESIIDGKKYFCAYYHLIENYVEEKQDILTGQLIGMYADVGMSYGAHLHFMMWDEHWKVVNPQIGLGV
jgi:murein DD-endopeptidase MepM/ murein hydrolase activator NlpD